MNGYPELRDRVVLITGAGRGLGEALAVAFVEQDSRAALVDIDASALARVRASLGGSPDRVIEFAADISDTATCERIVEQTVGQFGALDILVNNAAIIARMPLDAITEADFDRVIAVNLRAPFFLSRAALTVMRGRGRGGRIINVASMAARTGGTSDIPLYAASKGGLISLTKSIAKMAAPSGVLVNAILPSNIESPMLRDVFPADALERTISSIPLGRTAAPREVAELVLWLASDASGYVTGVNWDINGGWFMT